MFPTSAPFVNQNNKLWVIQQLLSRPSGKIPNHIEKSASIDLLEKEIKPLEKRAIIYKEGLENDTIKEIFFRFLNQENITPLSLENENKIHEIKNSLLKLRQKFSNLLPNLNCLKIVRIQLAASSNTLIKDKDFCQIKPSHSQTHSNRARQPYAKSFADFFSQQMDYFFRWIDELEEKIVEDQLDCTKLFQEIDNAKKEIELSLMAVSQLSEKNQNIKNAILNIQQNLNLLSNLQLAPQTLLPLAILATPVNHQPFSFNEELKEFGELLEEQFYFTIHLIEILCTAGLKSILQGGSQVKKYKKEIEKFFRSFKENFVNLNTEIQKTYQSAYQKLYIKPSQFSDQYFQNCNEVLKNLKFAQVNQLPKLYFELLTILDNAKRSIKSEFYVDGLIRQHLTSIFENYFKFYTDSILSLEYNLNIFLKAHQTKYNCIPIDQRKMKAQFYTPIDLIYFNILDLMWSICEEPNSDATQPVVSATITAYEIVKKSQQFYEFNFPNFNNQDRSSLSSLCKILNSEVDEAQEQASSSPQLQLLISKLMILVECLSLFVETPLAYPFFCGYLGSEPLQNSSHEHEFSARLINHIYTEMETRRAKEFNHNFELVEKASLLEHPETIIDQVKVTQDPVNENLLNLDVSLNWEKNFISRVVLQGWEEIPTATPSNLAQVCLPFERLMNRLQTNTKDLMMKKFVEENVDSNSIDAYLLVLEAFVLTPYRHLSRYVIQTSLIPQTFPRKKKIQTTAQSHPLVNSTSTTKDSPALSTPVPKLFPCAQDIGQFLALAIHDISPSALLDMRDFYSQIVYHLGSIEDLIHQGTHLLSILQLQTLLTHQACVLEQMVKLAALARQCQNSPSEDLKELLRSSHRPSDFIEKFLPKRSLTNSTEWKKTLQAASAVDGFLTGPARYALKTHPWIGLLTDQKEEIIQKIIQNNLSAIQVLLADILLSIPKSHQPFVESASPISALEGLKEKKLLQFPSLTSYTLPVTDPLYVSLDLLSKLVHVPRLSRDEATSDLVQRREEIHANLHIIQTNLLQIDDLLQVQDGYIWCSSYASTLLLRGAAVLEKSLQTLLFWLPVTSQNQPELHHLLSIRLDLGSPIPFKHTHVIEKNSLLCAHHLYQKGDAKLAEKLQNFGQKFSWLDPFIQQLYRYPFSPTETRAVNLLRQFHTLAELRRSLHQGDTHIKEALQKAFETTPENTIVMYDQLIQSHLIAHVLAPVQEILQASGEVLETLVKLSNCGI